MDIYLQSVILIFSRMSKAEVNKYRSRARDNHSLNIKPARQPSRRDWSHFFRVATFPEASINHLSRPPPPPPLPLPLSPSSDT